VAGPSSGVVPRPYSGLCLSARRRVSLAAVPPAASETYLPSSVRRQSFWGALSLSLLTPASYVWKVRQGPRWGADAKTSYDSGSLADAV